MDTDFEPVVENVLHRKQLRLPFVHLVFVRFYERRAFHRLSFDDVIVQQLLYVVYS